MPRPPGLPPLADPASLDPDPHIPDQSPEHDGQVQPTGESADPAEPRPPTTRVLRANRRAEDWVTFPNMTPFNYLDHNPTTPPFLRDDPLCGLLLERNAVCRWVGKRGFWLCRKYRPGVLIAAALLTFVTIVLLALPLIGVGNDPSFIVAFSLTKGTAHWERIAPSNWAVQFHAGIQGFAVFSRRGEGWFMDYDTAECAELFGGACAACKSAGRQLVAALITGLLATCSAFVLDLHRVFLFYDFNLSKVLALILHFIVVIGVTLWALIACSSRCWGALPDAIRLDTGVVAGIGVEYEWAQGSVFVLVLVALLLQIPPGLIQFAVPTPSWAHHKIPYVHQPRDTDLKRKVSGDPSPVELSGEGRAEGDASEAKEKPRPRAPDGVQVGHPAAEEVEPAPHTAIDSHRFSQAATAYSTALNSQRHYGDLVIDDGMGSSVGNRRSSQPQPSYDLLDPDAASSSNAHFHIPARTRQHQQLLPTYDLLDPDAASSSTAHFPIPARTGQRQQLEPTYDLLDPDAASSSTAHFPIPASTGLRPQTLSPLPLSPPANPLHTASPQLHGDSFSYLGPSPSPAAASPTITRRFPTVPPTVQGDRRL